MSITSSYHKMSSDASPVEEVLISKPVSREDDAKFTFTDVSFSVSLLISFFSPFHLSQCLSISQSIVLLKLITFSVSFSISMYSSFFQLLSLSQPLSCSFLVNVPLGVEVFMFIICQ